MDSVFFEFAQLLFISVLVGALAIRLKQPLIVAFIIVGIVVGPAFLDLAQSHQALGLLAEMGVTILLFAVGLKLDFHLVRNLGPVALATGIGQLTFTIIFGFILSITLGMNAITALYVSVALTFSSTIIIVKLLSDKREMDSLHGRIAMGFLIVQDIAVVVAMMAIGSTEGMADGHIWWKVAEIFLKILIAIAGIILLMRFFLTPALHLLARSQELLLIFSVAWGVSLAAIGDIAGFSKEVGAFLAGFSLASSHYRYSINSRLASLRDFLLLFFFIELGTILDFSTLGDSVPAAIILALFVLIGNPLIVIAIMGFMGYRKRTGFLAGLTVAQISEFSIIFISLGVSQGHVEQSALGLVTLVGLITITTSTYMILYSGKLFALLGKFLEIFERDIPHRELADEEKDLSDKEADLIVFGLGRYGKRLLKQLTKRGVRAIGVDFDPQIVRACQQAGSEAIYGDAEDPDFPDALPLRQVKWIMVAIHNLEGSLSLIRSLREHGYEGKLIATIHSHSDGKILEEHGVDHFFLPLSNAADYAVEQVCHFLSENNNGKAKDETDH